MPGSIPLIGERFPEMEVTTDHGVIKLPDHYVSQGKWFVLFSHPADFTPVCTTEFVSFARRYEDFQRLGVDLIGLSVDSVFSHIKWKEWIERHIGVRIPFPIIADPQGTVARRLGLLHAESATHTVRGVFIVDARGVIRTMLYYPMELGRLVDEILRIVKALKLGDSLKRAVPADWPNNEIIGEGLIVPPPTTEDQARARMESGQYRSLDWWFCWDTPASRDDVEEARRYLRRAAEKPAKLLYEEARTHLH
uniref:Probable peroxiredoxin n=2 Tax=Aeropyrum pernix (strain ATCC 700893 / DSM 11879 / JCM 9820 / NBRC 100138 / K1) TaxID=272557 RepID=UPI0001751520|nr:Chain A, Probable peroxiredoxin [Aeropyrum pernix K1]2E2G_B Chain B, Probable peroxiredoxin [Aeropyrum pernix K1]2E2G_C Chain C, Probable peroxiredoxin [Aeropyrum pernix K1]2E2G_D Chain D, Probable peroxiredoxin [Aeropyrum pernix K1]2E2G_E Chain E, Probable peroxiredoxin [Aeropyrum pernix K1]2E2G_F Chain F, Probable peroxiredoxin [Aeropyrum pernix K1]2E2G_G Chain G, Probable peroxiredoxin [Aeropyrum pernix K1]2E2G_H Chain H, Probable peroxiredoxin [Aeropyrum pernix K1]2E2G_I Chain I, Pro